MGYVVDGVVVRQKTVDFTPETMPEDATTEENYRDYTSRPFRRHPQGPGMGERNLRHVGGRHHLVCGNGWQEQCRYLPAWLRGIPLPRCCESVPGVHNRRCWQRPTRQVQGIGLLAVGEGKGTFDRMVHI